MSFLYSFPRRDRRPRATREEANPFGLARSADSTLSAHSTRPLARLTSTSALHNGHPAHYPPQQATDREPVTSTRAHTSTRRVCMSPSPKTFHKWFARRSQRARLLSGGPWRVARAGQQQKVRPPLATVESSSSSSRRAGWAARQSHPLTPRLSLPFPLRAPLGAPSRTTPSGAACAHAGFSLITTGESAGSWATDAWAWRRSLSESPPRSPPPSRARTWRGLT